MTETSSEEPGDTAPEIGATEVLTEHEEREIVFRNIWGAEGYRDLSAEYEVAVGTIQNILDAYRGHSGTELEESILDEFGDG